MTENQFNKAQERKRRQAEATDKKPKPVNRSWDKKFTGYVQKTRKMAREGLSQVAISELLGIHPVTLTRWKGSDAKVANALRIGYAEFRRDNMKAISKAKRKNWQAAAWLLERRFPDEYGRKSATPDVNATVTAPDGTVATFSVGVTEAELPE